MPIRSALLLLALPVWILAGCSHNGVSCDAGTSRLCTCAGSEIGLQICQSSGAYDVCACATDAGCDPGQVVVVDAGVELCLPPTVCNPETCPPQLGSCDGGACVYNAGYAGVRTLPEVWATYYCELPSGECDGVTQLQPVATTAARVAQQFGIPLCANVGAGAAGVCVGVSGSSPMVIGNSEEAIDPSTNQRVAKWGRGLTEASGLCYRIAGPGGDAIVALTDRCGGYCKCAGSGFEECSPCVNAPDLQVNCSCVGSVPGVYGQCCGAGCASPEADCDWCASNNHAHFNLDNDTFAHVCGSGAVVKGSCQLSAAQYVPCVQRSPAWPPPTPMSRSSAASPGAR